MEHVLNQHKLVINRDVVMWDYNSTSNLPPETAVKYQLFYQMSRITRDRGALAHDDRLDCLAMAVAYWVEQMGQDVDKRIEARKDDLLKKELEVWMRGTRTASTRHLVGAGGNDEHVFSFDAFVLGG